MRIYTIHYRTPWGTAYAIKWAETEKEAIAHVRKAQGVGLRVVRVESEPSPWETVSENV